MPPRADCFTTIKGKDGNWRWQVKATNGEIVAPQDGDGYHDEAEAKLNAKRTYAFLKAANDAGKLD